MSITLANFGGTMTGGSSVVLSHQNTVDGKSTFYTSSHTRLAPQVVEFLTQPAKTTAADPGVARAQMRITLANRETEEGCCTVQSGVFAIDVNVRWSLNQPETLVDTGLDYLQSLAFTQALADMIKKGVLPI